MRTIVAAFFILVSAWAGAQTKYNYNVHCGTDYYFVALGFGHLLWSSNSDTAADINFYNQELKKNFYISATKVSNTEGNFSAFSDSLFSVSFVVESNEMLTMKLVEAKGKEEKSIGFTRRLSSEAVSIDYYCFFAHRAIYYKTDEGSDSVAMEIQHRYPMPAKGTAKADSIRFVKAITSHLTGLPAEFVYPTDLAKNSDIAWVQDYTSMYEAGDVNVQDGMANWEIDEQTIAIFQKADILGFVESNYEYSGGAHGVYSSFYYNYDFKSDSLLGLSDLFVENYEPALEELINAQIRKDLEIADDALLSDNDFFVEVVPVTSNFTLTNIGILFLYNVYEIAPYVYGSIVVEIPYEAMDTLILNGGPADRMKNAH